jgi:hypothetical protein
MTRDQMLAELREVLAETSSDGAWSEYTLLGYLAEGQDKFCEETGFFADVANCTVTTVVGTAIYAIPDRVIQVLDIWDGTRKLGRFQEEDKTLPPQPGTPATFAASGSDSYAWQADSQTGSITLFPTPTAIKTYQLRVWRYSRTDLADDGGEPELPTRLQRACIQWAAYKAMNTHDLEQEDPIKAADHLAAFRQYVTDGKAALRRLHAVETRVEPNLVYRV